MFTLRRVKRFSLLIILQYLLWSTTVFSQDTTPVTNRDAINQQLENISEISEDENNDYSNLIEYLDYFKLHPINLNNTSSIELQQLHLLNDIQINNLLKHIEENGTLLSIYELQSIPYFDLITINSLLSYIRVSSNDLTNTFNVNELIENGKHNVFLRYSRVIEKQEGYKDTDSTALSKSINSRYVGSPDKLYARYNYAYSNKISWGMTAEKDQGELFLKGNKSSEYDTYENKFNGNVTNGFDFYSAHLFMQNVGFVKALAIGDYHVSFGQGLTTWSGFAFGKSTDIKSIKRNGGGISAFKSVDENRFLRGGATTLQLNNWEASIFVSHKQIDANIVDTLEGEVLSVSSLQTTGYHRTPGEMEDKDAIQQRVVGGNVTYKKRNFNVGVTVMDYFVDAKIKKELQSYNQFEGTSSGTTNIGVDYNLVIKNFNLFGEEAYSVNGGWATINGALIHLHRRIYFTTLYRDYQRNYQNNLNNAIAEGSKTSNEKGLYNGINIQASNAIKIAAYYDVFKFPWLRYQADAPTWGNEYIAQVNYSPSKKLKMYVRFRKREKQKNVSANTSANSYLITSNQNNIRFHISNQIRPCILLKNRIEFTNYKGEEQATKQGYLIYQDIVYQPMGSPFGVKLRYAVFETDDYDSRIYAYENDIAGVFSIPSLYDKGSRFYIMLTYKINRHIKCWVRYSQTFYDNTSAINEGSLNEIKGDTKSEIKAQVLFGF